MTPQQYERLTELFHAALEIGSQRACSRTSWRRNCLSASRRKKNIAHCSNRLTKAFAPSNCFSTETTNQLTIAFWKSGRRLRSITDGFTAWNQNWRYIY